MKAIDTFYQGHLFRSRLEARWAVFFDALEIKWEYEADGYDLGGGIWYLPDFWLPEYKCFAEVKPQQFSEDELSKCQKLAELSGYSCILLDGRPDMRSYPMLSVDYWCIENGEYAKMVDGLSEDESCYHVESTFIDLIPSSYLPSHLGFEGERLFSDLWKIGRSNYTLEYKLAVVAAGSERF